MCLVRPISAFVILVLLGTTAGMKLSLITPHLHAQSVNTALMPQTAQYLVPMEPSVIVLELGTYLSAISALLAAFVHSPIVVSMVMSVQMALSAHLEELHLPFVWLVISAIRPKHNCRARKGITALRALLQPLSAQRDITVIRQIDVIMIHCIRMQVPVVQLYVHWAIVTKAVLRERTSTKHARSADLVTMVMIPTAQFVRYAAVV